MREDEILAQVINDISPEVGNNVDVRVAGGDQDTDVPEIVLQWNAVRLPDANGHTPFAGYTTDNNGDRNGREHHAYFQMEIDVLFRYYDEITKDKAANSVQMAFLPYEHDATAFNRETREWAVSDVSPRENQVIEPDWYESGVLLRFEYVKKTEKTSSTADPIETITDDVEPDETIDETSTNVKT